MTMNGKAKKRRERKKAQRRPTAPRPVGWERVGTRKRIQLAREDEREKIVSAFVAQVEELQRRFNLLVLDHTALKRLFLRIGHDHPESAIVLPGGVVRCRPISIEDFDIAVSEERQRVIAEFEAQQREAAQLDDASNDEPQGEEHGSHR